MYPSPKSLVLPDYPLIVKDSCDAEHLACFAASTSLPILLIGDWRNDRAGRVYGV
jgi:hypothetical protein